MTLHASPQTRGATTDTYSYLPSSGGGNSPVLAQIQLGAGGTRTYQFGPAGHLERVTLGSNSTLYSSDAATLYLPITNMFTRQ